VTPVPGLSGLKGGDWIPQKGNHGKSFEELKEAEG